MPFFDQVFCSLDQLSYFFCPLRTVFLFLPFRSIHSFVVFTGESLFLSLDPVGDGVLVREAILGVCGRGSDCISCPSVVPESVLLDLLEDLRRLTDVLA